VAELVESYLTHASRLAAGSLDGVMEMPIGARSHVDLLAQTIRPDGLRGMTSELTIPGTSAGQTLLVPSGR
jgi:hypothetical protein